MRSAFRAVLGLSLLAAFPAMDFPRAEDAPQTDATKACDVPAYLLSSESALPKAAEAVKNGQPLTILVVGSRSSTIASSESSAYPAQLLAALKEKLPQIQVSLSVELQTSKTAEEVDAALVKLVEAKKPTLVIWQTGTVDAMRKSSGSTDRIASTVPVCQMTKVGLFASTSLTSPAFTSSAVLPFCSSRDRLTVTPGSFSFSAACNLPG